MFRVWYIFIIIVKDLKLTWLPHNPLLDYGWVYFSICTYFVMIHSGVPYFRYMAITKPLHYPQLMNTKVFTIMSVLIWTTAISIGCIMPFSWHNDWDEVNKMCDLILILDHSYVKYILFPFNMLTSLCIIFMYIHIFHVAYKQV